MNYFLALIYQKKSFPVLVLELPELRVRSTSRCRQCSSPAGIDIVVQGIAHILLGCKRHLVTRGLNGFHLTVHDVACDVRQSLDKFAFNTGRVVDPSSAQPSG